jgi:tripartite-type tricarboxylate transporter receptor subunit TctC
LPATLEQYVAHLREWGIVNTPVAQIQPWGANGYDVFFDAIPTSIEHIRTGKLRALAITTVNHSAILPDIPAMSDLLPRYEASFWAGFGAPKNTPAEIVDRLNREINAALADPNVKARFADLGGTLLPGSPADFGQHIAAETAKWAQVVKFSGVRPK